MQVRYLFFLGILMAGSLAQAQTCRASREELRDARGGLFGTIDTRADCTQEARDARGVFRGSFNPGTRQTRDYAGRLYSMGNTLAALVVCAAGQGQATGVSHCEGSGKATAGPAPDPDPSS